MEDMEMKSIFSDHINVAAKVLDFQLQRQNIVSANLANINTPGYKARKLEFEDDLQAALGLSDAGTMSRTNHRHLPSTGMTDLEATVSKPFAPRVVQSVDNVDLDTEMAVMAKNNLAYNTLALVLQKSFAGLKQTIQEGAK